VADHERRIQAQVHLRPLHHRAHVRVLHHDQRPDGAVHAEPEPAEGVPGEPEAAQQHVLGAGQPEVGRLRRGGGHGPGAGGRHDHMEDDRAEQHTDGVDNIHRVVERPEPQAQAVHAGTHRGRAGHQRGAARLYLLLLRAARGSGRPGRVPASGHDRRLDDDGHGHIQLHRRRVFGKFSKFQRSGVDVATIYDNIVDLIR